MANFSRLTAVIFFFSFFFGVYSQQTVQGSEWVEKKNEQKESLLLIEFWATWCIPCIHSMDHIEYLVKKNKESLSVVYISDQSTGVIRNFMDERMFSFNSISDPEKRSIIAFNVNSLPTSILLAPSGEIIWRGVPSDLNQNLLDRYIDKYKGDRVNSKRIELTNQKQVKEHFKTFRRGDEKVLYKVSESPELQLTSDSRSFYFNGPLLELVSAAYDIPLKRISNERLEEENYTVQINELVESNYQLTLKEFLKKELGIEVVTTMKSVDGYVISGTRKTTSLPKETYDFSESHVNFLAGDMNVEIDNATGNEMVIILDRLSKLHFQAGEFDEMVFDWNVHHKFSELLFEQLKSELNLDVSEEKIEVPFLIIQ